MSVLIQSKLLPPVDLGAAVDRRYGMDQLRAGLGGHATLVVAPAGYGKTELLARWFRQCRAQGRRSGWISLEPEDAQLDVFVDYALAALGLPAAGAPVRAPTTRRAAIARLLAACIGDDGPSLLFLDDFERLGGALDEFVRLLIGHTAPRLHLVIGSRVPPAIGLASLRARRLVTELGVDTLRMGFQEARALLACGARSVTDGDVALLLQRTEGWPIALRMAADFVQSHPDAAAPLTGFSGRAAELADYLYDAILVTLSQDEQHALLAMACVPRVCGELLNELAGRLDGGALLQDFARRNMLLSRLDDEGRWYRVHPLLADFLQHRLTQVDAAAPARLGQRAARWFSRCGMLPEALRAASAVGDAGLLAMLLDRAGGWRLVIDGRIGLLRAHLDQVDDETLLRFPRLALARPLLLAKAGLRWQAGVWLERVREASHGFADARDSAAPGYAADQLALEAPIAVVVVGWYLDDAPPGGYAQEIHALVARADPAADPLLAATAGNLLCYELQCARRHGAAWDAAAQALRVAEGSGFRHQSLYLRYIQLGLLVEQARLPQADALARELHDEAERADGVGGDMAAVADVLHARVLALQGDAAGAVELLDRALPQVLEQDAWFDILWAGHAAAAGAAVLSGDAEAALAALDRASALAERRRLQRLGARVQIHRIDLLLARGDLALAGSLGEALDLPGLQRRFEAIDRRVADAAWLAAWSLRATPASALAATGDGPDAASLARELAGRIRDWADEGSALQAIDALIRQAAAHVGWHDDAAAAQALERALAVAVPGQVLLPFIERGLPLVELLEQALVRSGGRGAPNLRARFLAAALDGLRRRPRARSAGHGLSPRESEIAALLVQGLSNKLIGRALSLSEGTVKFHLRNLYAKLGAHTRDEAVRLLG